MNDMLSQWRLYGRALFHWEFADWLWKRIWLDDIPGRAAQLSYYFLLSLFPLLICFSGLLAYAFAVGVGLEQRLLSYLSSMMPSAATEVVRTALDDLLRERGGGKLSFGLLVALWLASSGMEAVIEGLNVAFQVGVARPWWRRRLLALGLTTAFAVFTGIALGLAVAGRWFGQNLMDLLRLESYWLPLWHAAQWIGSFSFLLLSIHLVYFFGPNLGPRRRTQIFMPGAVVALFCWISASMALRFYLNHFSAFGKTYGSLGAVIALLLWLYLTGAALLLGAEVNSGIQRRLENVKI